MVEDACKTVLEAEKELEHMANEASGSGTAQQLYNETRLMAEKSMNEFIKLSENWGKSASEKVREIVEDICL